MAKKVRNKGSRVKHTKRAVAARGVKRSGAWSIFDKLGGSIVPLVLSLAIVVCLGLVMFLTYGSVSESEFFELKGVNVTGTDRASKDDIEKIVHSNAEKPGVWNADLLEIKQKIEKVTFVKTAAVSRSLPSGINVAITERVPVAIVRMNSGDFLADAEGTILAPAASEEKKVPFVMLGWNEEKSERVLRLLDIGSGNFEAEIAQHLRDAAHADAADADKVNFLYVPEHSIRVLCCTSEFLDLYSLSLGSCENTYPAFAD